MTRTVNTDPRATNRAHVAKPRAGAAPVNVPAAVRYLRPEEGGVSHFNYWRDNVLLTSMYLRLALGFFMRLPLLIARRMM